MSNEAKGAGRNRRERLTVTERLAGGREGAERSGQPEVPALADRGTQGQGLLEVGLGLNAFCEDRGTVPLGVGCDSRIDCSLLHIGPALHE